LIKDDIDEIKTVEINTFMINDPKDKARMMDKLREERKYISWQPSLTNETIILRFFKFLIFNLPDRKIIFDIAKGRVIRKTGGDARINKGPFVR